MSAAEVCTEITMPGLGEPTGLPRFEPLEFYAGAAVGRAMREAS